MSKTAFHVQVENRDPNYDDRMMNLKPPGMTLVCAQSSLWWAWTFHLRSPSTRFTIRMAEGEDDRKSAVGHADPKIEAQNFAKFCHQYIPKKNEDGSPYPYAALRNLVYFQPYDELGGNAADPETRANLEWLNLYTKYAVDEFKARGLMFSAVNFAEGNPPQKPYDAYDGWPLLFDALRAINTAGPSVAIVGLHTYGFNTGLFDSTDTHLLRFEYLERYLDAQGLNNVYIGLHETGKDTPSFADSYNYYTPKGYATRPDDMTGYTAYANDMIEFDKIISAKRRILWGNWYTLDMLDDGYEVKDHVTQKGPRVIEVYPLFSIVEHYLQASPPQYVLNGQGPIEVPSNTPPSPGEPAAPYEAITTVAGLNLRDGDSDTARLIKSLPLDYPVTVINNGTRRATVRVVIEGTVLRTGVAPK